MINTPNIAAAVTQSWTYDEGNRITSYTNSVDGTIDYDYDNTDQLTEAGNNTYDYDEAGNRTDFSGTQNTIGAGNRLESDGVYDYTYDDEGNRISKTEISTGRSWTYEWDHRNRLVAVHSPSPDNNEFTLHLEYDVFNRRTEHYYDRGYTWYWNFADSPQYYIYDGDNVVIDFGYPGWPVTPNGTQPDTVVARKYLFGPAVDQVLAVESLGDPTPIYAADRVKWFLHDHQNTTRDLVDNTGELFAHYPYDAFGRMTVGIGYSRYLYTGREYDHRVGLQYNRNRWYDPAVGRWLAAR